MTAENGLSRDPQQSADVMSKRSLLRRLPFRSLVMAFLVLAVIGMCVDNEPEPSYADPEWELLCEQREVYLADYVAGFQLEPVREGDPIFKVAHTSMITDT